MSLKYDSHDLYILRRRTEANGKVWLYALVHEMKRRAIFYSWAPGCTAARRISNQLLNHPNTLRQRYVCSISTPHLEDFFRVMGTDWQALGADGDREFIALSLVELERIRLVPDGTQSHWVNVLMPECQTPPTSESSSLPSSGSGSVSSGSSSSSSGNDGSTTSDPATRVKSSGGPSPSGRGQPSHPLSSAVSIRSSGRHAKRIRPSESAPKENQRAEAYSPSLSDRGTRRDPPARKDRPGRRD